VAVEHQKACYWLLGRVRWHGRDRVVTYCGMGCDDDT
jgi:hypothetical protein